MGIQPLSDTLPSPGLLAWLREQVLPDDNVLDIGCGDKRYEDTGCRWMWSVDAWSKAEPDLLVDLSKINLPFRALEFDVIFLLDFLEHLDKSRGKEILMQTMLIASRSVIVLTPLPEFWDDNKAAFIEPGWWQGNPWTLHRSVWGPEDFSGEGWMQHFLSGFENYYLGAWAK